LYLILQPIPLSKYTKFYYETKYVYYKQIGSKKKIVFKEWGIPITNYICIKLGNTIKYDL